MSAKVLSKSIIPCKLSTTHIALKWEFGSVHALVLSKTAILHKLHTTHTTLKRVLAGMDAKVLLKKRTV
jgi:hypothetical protein